MLRTTTIELLISGGFLRAPDAPSGSKEAAEYQKRSFFFVSFGNVILTLRNFFGWPRQRNQQQKTKDAFRIEQHDRRPDARGGRNGRPCAGRQQPGRQHPTASLQPGRGRRPAAQASPHLCRSLRNGRNLQRRRAVPGRQKWVRLSLAPQWPNHQSRTV